MPLGEEEKGNVVNKVLISLNCLPCESSPGEKVGGGAQERLPAASMES